MDTTTGYMVTIKTQPTSQYQAYKGWDTVYATRREAQQAAKRAKDAGHYRTRVVKVERD
jgi:hypothetical protein